MGILNCMHTVKIKPGKSLVEDNLDNCVNENAEWSWAGYLIGSLQIRHQHLNLIGPEKHNYCYNQDCDRVYSTPTKTQHTSKKQR